MRSGQCRAENKPYSAPKYESVSLSGLGVRLRSSKRGQECPALDQGSEKIRLLATGGCRNLTNHCSIKASSTATAYRIWGRSNLAINTHKMPQPDLVIRRIPQGCGGTSGGRSSASPVTVTLPRPKTAPGHVVAVSSSTARAKPSFERGSINRSTSIATRRSQKRPAAYWSGFEEPSNRV
jgi:hypothetical protein